MIVKDFSFNRNFLKHANYTNGYHVYTGMKTISDQSGNAFPDSIVKLLYRIYTESSTALEREETLKNSERTNENG
jgi:hypothetical protein